MLIVKDRRSEAEKAKEKEGSGAVPNVTEKEVQQKTDESAAKEALHDLEEEKGDWSKGR